MALQCAKIKITKVNPLQKSALNQQQSQLVYISKSKHFYENLRPLMDSPRFEKERAGRGGGGEREKVGLKL